MTEIDAGTDRPGHSGADRPGHAGTDRLRHADDYRDAATARTIAERLHRLVEPGRHYRIMEVCGGHTHAIFRHGIHSHVPEQVTFVHGPGCPVCVLPMGRIDDAVWLARQPDVIFATYGDVLRVPGTDGSLADARATGADVRIVYSPLDALRLAEQHPDRQVVFLAIGFETTAPATAITVRAAAERGITNFSVLCHHVLVVPPVEALLGSGDVPLDALIGPGHVAAIIGCEPFTPIAQEFALPIVIAGFEPLDLLAAIEMALTQLRDGRAEVQNQYARLVPWHGNPAAASLFDDVFETRPSTEWRGLGAIPRSGYGLSDRYRGFDAEARFSLPGRDAADPKACRCGDVLRGVITPPECRVYGTACTPEHPIGACMVSSEGACAAYFRHLEPTAVAGPTRR